MFHMSPDLLVLICHVPCLVGVAFVGHMFHVLLVLIVQSCFMSCWCWFVIFPHSSVLMCSAVFCCVLLCSAVFCCVLLWSAVFCNVLLCFAVCVVVFFCVQLYSHLFCCFLLCSVVFW